MPSCLGGTAGLAAVTIYVPPESRTICFSLAQAAPSAAARARYPLARRDVGGSRVRACFAHRAPVVRAIAPNPRIPAKKPDCARFFAGFAVGGAIVTTVSTGRH